MRARRRRRWLDGACALLAGACVAHYLWHHPRLVTRMAMVDDLPPGDVAVGVLFALLLLEASRRHIGAALPILALAFVAYAFVGPWLPGFLSHGGEAPLKLVDAQMFTTGGVFGIPTLVSATFIYLFVLFGGVMSHGGLLRFFTDAALAVAGHTRGGAGKVAVISSGLFGTVNGSAIANAVTTGAFTIPLMMRAGYRPSFAAGVEATASMGGQLIPPVMGAAAFIMAETLGVSYGTVALAAAIPGVLYFIAVGVMVHFEAARQGLPVLPRAELPRLRGTGGEPGPAGHPHRPAPRGRDPRRERAERPAGRARLRHRRRHRRRRVGDRPRAQARERDRRGRAGQHAPDAPDDDGRRARAGHGAADLGDLHHHVHHGGARAGAARRPEARGPHVRVLLRDPRRPDAADGHLDLREVVHRRVGRLEDAVDGDGARALGLHHPVQLRLRPGAHDDRRERRPHRAAHGGGGARHRDAGRRPHRLSARTGPALGAGGAARRRGAPDLSGGARRFPGRRLLRAGVRFPAGSAGPRACAGMTGLTMRGRTVHHGGFRRGAGVAIARVPAP
ncbi:MAG: TRAP transporter fused permease subunit [Candidatus Rokubacteria bacterium]|nr:TRAP transporter fused permease subunit [Candidatus Rokubacteria bacterium]